MNILKNILFVSYLKNKGVRRLCFVSGIVLFVIFSCFSLSGIYKRQVDVKYNNLQELNSQFYFAAKNNLSTWAKRQECAAIYFKKYGFTEIEAYSFSGEQDIFQGNFCRAFPEKCEILKAMRNKPIHLQCNGLESYFFNSFEAALIIFTFLVFAFYFPFILCILLKFVGNICLWIYKGFKE